MLLHLLFTLLVTGAELQGEARTEELRWIALDLAEGHDPISVLPPALQTKAMNELSARVETQHLDEPGRPIAYDGEDHGLLCYLLGVSPVEAENWLSSPDLNFRLVGLGTQISGSKSLSRALLAPLDQNRWLLVLSKAATLDEAKLRRHLKAGEARKKLIERLYNLFRDAHAARNAESPKPPRLGYPAVSNEGELEIGDPKSEKAFGFQANEFTKRLVGQRCLETGGKHIDDGIATTSEKGSFQFSLDLQSLISDDLLLVARTDSPGRGKLFVDGIELGSWNPTVANDCWGEVVARISNRLISGKEKAVFEIRPAGSQPVSIFRLQALRTPTVDGSYLSDMTLNYQGAIGIDCTPDKRPMILGGYRFLKGISTPAPSTLVIKLDGNPRSFQAFVGVDSAAKSEREIIFRVFVDGKEKFHTKRMNSKDSPDSVFVSVREAKELKLVTENAGDAPETVTAIWAEARLLK